MRTLVTGGTGFLGKILVARLLREGRQVRVLVRDPERLGDLPREQLDICRGDLLDADSLRRAVQDVDEVVHAAALVKRWVKDRSQFDRVNVEATRILMEHAREASVGRIVYVSSFFALGHSDGGHHGIVDETWERDPQHTHTDYERTKYLADKCVREMIEDGLPAIIVYPCVIYGPGELSEANIIADTLSQHLRGKLPGIPGNGQKRWTYAYVDDVVDGILAALERGDLGRRYILGGDTASMDGFFQLFHEISGRKPPGLHVPFPVLAVAAFFEELKARLFRSSPKMTRSEVRTYQHNWAYACQRARDELGYRPRALRDGLRKTYEWLLECDPALAGRHTSRAAAQKTAHPGERG